MCLSTEYVSCGRSLGIPLEGTVTPSHQRDPLMGRSLYGPQVQVSVGRQMPFAGSSRPLPAAANGHYVI
jgi:hypothetical protein